MEPVGCRNWDRASRSAAGRSGGIPRRSHIGSAPWMTLPSKWRPRVTLTHSTRSAACLAISAPTVQLCRLLACLSYQQSWYSVIVD